MRDYNKNKESLYLNYWKLAVDDFKWVEKISQFSKDFTKNYFEDSDEGYFLEVDVQYPEKFHGLLNERIIIEKVNKVVANLHNKKNMLYIQEIQNKH